LDLTVDDLPAAARWVGDDAGSAFRVAVDGVAGEDFWKKPRMDLWFFMFWVLDVDRFKAGVAAAGEDAAPLPLAIACVRERAAIC
jgi:hypothetical protein